MRWLLVVSACAHAASSPAVGDRDHDGIVDDRDKCPDEPETFNGYQDEDGCPDAPRTQFVAGNDELPAIIYFTQSSADLVPQDDRELQAVVDLLGARPELEVTIRGHIALGEVTQLAEQRAGAVRAWLAGHGIDARRISIRPLGPRATACDRDPEVCRARERRVDFQVAPKR